MKIAPMIIQTAITAFVTLIGQDGIFTRIMDEIERTNERMPDSTGEEKRAQVLADIKIIFDDLIAPVAKSVVNLLIELGVAYVKAKAAQN